MPAGAAAQEASLTVPLRMLSEGWPEVLRSEIQQVKSTVVALTDVEHRLRAVERWRYALPLTGVTALLAAAAAIWGH